MDKLLIWMQKTWLNEMAGNFLMKWILGTFGSFWRQSGRIRHQGASSGQWRRSYPPHHNHSQSRSVPINIHEKWKCPLKESESDYKFKDNTPQFLVEKQLKQENKVCEKHINDIIRKFYMPKLSLVCSSLRKVVLLCDWSWEDKKLRLLISVCLQRWRHNPVT